MNARVRRRALTRDTRANERTDLHCETPCYTVKPCGAYFVDSCWLIVWKWPVPSCHAELHRSISSIYNEWDPSLRSGWQVAL